MKKYEIISCLKQCSCAFVLVLILSALLACGDDTSVKDESDMVTTETGTNLATREETYEKEQNPDLGTGGNQTATENSSTIGSDNNTSGNESSVADDLSNGVESVVDGVTDGVKDVVDGAADGVEDAAEGIADGANNVVNGASGKKIRSR